MSLSNRDHLSQSNRLTRAQFPRFMLLFLLFAAQLLGTPAGDMLREKDIPLKRRICIAPVALFQQVSYALPSLNCQFEPSCSQYVAEAIARHGALPGLILGADRIVRCNPWAHHYHLRSSHMSFYGDGRLLDPVPEDLQPWDWQTMNAPALIPGLSRARAGRPGDGIVSFLMVASLAGSTLKLHVDERQIGAGLMGSLTIIFWLADIRYGTRTHINTQ